MIAALSSLGATGMLASTPNAARPDIPSAAAQVIKTAFQLNWSTVIAIKIGETVAPRLPHMLAQP